MRYRPALDDELLNNRRLLSDDWLGDHGGLLNHDRSNTTVGEERNQALQVLANEELERLESDLKVCERTLLAVELHDSIAQRKHLLKG